MSLIADAQLEIKKQKEELAKADERIEKRLKEKIVEQRKKTLEEPFEQRTSALEGLKQNEREVMKIIEEELSKNKNLKIPPSYISQENPQVEISQIEAI